MHGAHLTRGQRRAYLAPRGGGKSVQVTFRTALRSALEGWEPYIVILSDTATQSTKFLSDIRNEIETNTALRALYPESAGAGGEWREGSCRLKNGVLIESLSRGASIRGRRNREYRPSLIIFDDIQKNDDINSPTEREHTWDWATREVIPAGDESTNILSVGTALHRECVAVRIGSLPGWILKTFPAIHEWPERLDLWDEWERLATNLADPERAATAAAFYAEHRAEMDRGARVYWPEKFPLHVLMTRFAEIGRSAFWTEYQQIPTTVEGTEWPPEYFEDAPGKPLWFESWSQVAGQIVARVQSLDPSKGATAKPGDYQAHIIVALDKVGNLWIEADLRREPTPEMIKRAVDKATGEWGPVAELILEDNGTMGFLAPEVERVTRETGRMLPWRTFTQTEDKELRIRCLGPYLSRGVGKGSPGVRQVRIRNTPSGRLLVDQLRDFPYAQHDDAPDALSLAVKRLQELVLGK